ncbi:protein FAR-RED IMPAIRED RESPONSE 1-like [Ipomoea triloba]|uniref:protein FAR-RED IMPAIRED RESPONSE 1-like n=1 Tax=Ipomoea triloba TaxID=35885 RepID=UPI00125D3057|nr:protein FAR-RED IMPAIRED RESPONSE 1-like [Ipomoea triloba]
MGGKYPQSIITDQCAAIAAAISQVFPTSHNRLCIWHIGENSKKHIKTLRNNNDFMDLFNCLLKYTDTEAEFELCWSREKRCPTFNRDYFSRGILSSQMSESTNHSISRRLTKTAELCDFYSSFVSVVYEWRNMENGEDFRCAQGMPSMMVDDVKLLSHAREVYTIEIYYLFEEQFLKGTACHQESVLDDGCHFKYHVWRPDKDVIRHEVSFKPINLDICCNCKLFSELGILCCHCLRILNVHYVCSIHDKYILKRWTKKVLEGRTVDISSLSSNVGVAPSIWVVEMTRKFQRLIVSSQDNSATRQCCEVAFESAKKRVETEVGYIHIEEFDVQSSSGIVQNPSSRRLKGERNKRRSSIIQKKSAVARGRKSSANKVASTTKSVVQSMVLESLSEIVGDGYLVHPSSGSSKLVHVNRNSKDNVFIDL